MADHLPVTLGEETAQSLFSSSRTQHYDWVEVYSGAGLRWQANKNIGWTH